MPESPSLSAGGLPLLGLSCAVLRPAARGDTPPGGISAAATAVVLTDPLHLVCLCTDDGPRMLGPDAPQPDPSLPFYRPELQLRERRGFLIACPPDAERRGDPYAFGGNWLWSTDGRFPEPAPIAVHDRDLRLERTEPGVARNAVTNLPLDPAPQRADDSHMRGADDRGAPSQ